MNDLGANTICCYKYSPKDVVSNIEGEPFINTVPIETGLTNAAVKNEEFRVVGLNSENPELHEGMIRFDIIFYVRMRDGLSQDLTVSEKLDIIGTEYAIPMEKDFREDVSIMCNLSQKIKETGIEMGKREMIMKMDNKSYTAAQIADVAEMDEKQIKEIIKNAELLTV
nr:hypothetical protein [uncultured Blautia sp.]